MSAIKFTKMDAAALWRAVQAFGDCVKAMETMPELAPAAVEAEQAKYAAARKALLKVQAIRREQRRMTAKAAKTILPTEATHA